MNGTVPIWIYLLAPAAGLIGAAIGFFGALTVSRRATRTAFRQALYSKQLERQQDVLTTYFELLQSLHHMLIVRAAPSNNSRQIVAQDAEFPATYMQAHSYSPAHMIWIPFDLYDIYAEITQTLEQMFRELYEAASDDSITDEEYEVVREEIRQRTLTEGSNALTTLEMELLPYLGLKEHGIFILAEEAAIGDLDRPRRRWFPIRRRPWFPSRLQPRYFYRRASRPETIGQPADEPESEES
jgi:hypothetical protein